MAHAAVRDEARLLVAGVLAAASRAASDWPGESGCRCPLCRAAAAVRTPDPELSERLADAVGTVADGVAGLLRAWSDGAAGPDRTAANGDSPAAGAPGGAAAAGPTGGPADAAGEPADGGVQTKGDVGCQ